MLVQLGDILDRGEDEIAILSMLRSLDRQAKEKGGAVFQVWHLWLSNSKVSITGIQDYKTLELLSLITECYRQHHQGDDNSSCNVSLVIIFIKFLSSSKYKY